MAALRTFRAAMRPVARAAEIVGAAILSAQVLLLTYSWIQGVCGWKGQALWLSDVAEFALIPTGLLGAALAVRAGAHQGVDLLASRLPAKVQPAIDLFNGLLVAGFGLYFACVGALYVAATYQSGGTLPSAEVPKWIFYLGYPVSGILFALFSLEGLANRFSTPAAGAGPGAEAPAAPTPAAKPPPQGGLR